MNTKRYIPGFVKNGVEYAVKDLENEERIDLQEAKLNRVEADVNANYYNKKEVNEKISAISESISNVDVKTENLKADLNKKIEDHTIAVDQKIEARLAGSRDEIVETVTSNLSEKINDVDVKNTTKIGEVEESHKILNADYRNFTKGISIWDGSVGILPAVVNNTYNITTAQEFAAVAQFVNSGNNTRGITFNLLVDIDLDNYEWAPIGIDSQNSPFCGIF